MIRARSLLYLGKNEIETSLTKRKRQTLKETLDSLPSNKYNSQRQLELCVKQCEERE